MKDNNSAGMLCVIQIGFKLKAMFSRGSHFPSLSNWGNNLNSFVRCLLKIIEAEGQTGGENREQFCSNSRCLRVVRVRGKFFTHLPASPRPPAPAVKTKSSCLTRIKPTSLLLIGVVVHTGHGPFSLQLRGALNPPFSAP